MFALLTSHRLSGDFQDVLGRAVRGEVYPSNALTSYLFLAVGAGGLEAWEAIRLVSIASGLVYVACAVRIGVECFPDGARRAALTVLLLTAGTVALFFGTIEVYAPLAAAIALYLLVGIRRLAGRGRGVWPPLVLGIAFGIHGSAAFLVPSLVVLANGGRVWPARWRRSVAFCGLFLLPVLVLLASFLVSWGGEVPEAGPERYGTFLGAADQAPLLPLVKSPANLLNRYAIIDAEHLVGVLNLLLLASPAGLLLAVAGRGRGRDPRVTFLLTAAAALVAFALVWNVSFSLRRDWDLFSPMGIPIALLGGLLFLRDEIRPGTALRVAAVSLFCFVPFVIANTGGPMERYLYAGQLVRAHRDAGDPEGAKAWDAERERRDPGGVRETVLRADALAKDGRFVRAESLYRDALLHFPQNSFILTSLGKTLVCLGRPEEARDVLERAVRAFPGKLDARLVLVEFMLEEGRDDDAIRALERGIRIGNLHPQKGLALHMLGQLYIRRGDRESAEAVMRLAR